MTIQQLTVLIMAIAGVALFFTGRIFAKRLSPKKASFIPESVVTVKGIAAHFFTVVSWAGALLAAVCILLLFY